MPARPCSGDVAGEYTAHSTTRFIKEGDPDWWLYQPQAGRWAFGATLAMRQGAFGACGSAASPCVLVHEATGWHRHEGIIGGTRVVPMEITIRTTGAQWFNIAAADGPAPCDVAVPSSGDEW